MEVLSMLEAPDPKPTNWSLLGIMQTTAAPKEGAGSARSVKVTSEGSGTAAAIPGIAPTPIIREDVSV